jgi:hypothetical protein
VVPSSRRDGGRVHLLDLGVRLAVAERYLDVVAGPEVDALVCDPELDDLASVEPPVGRSRNRASLPCSGRRTASSSRVRFSVVPLSWAIRTR